MTQPRNPEREESLVAAPGTTSWDVARERLADPEHQWTNWLATTRPDGRPHLMPIIAVWSEDSFHFIAGEGTPEGPQPGHERPVCYCRQQPVASIDGHRGRGQGAPAQRPGRGSADG